MICYRQIFLDTTKLGRGTKNLGGPACKCLAPWLGAWSFERKGVHSYKSEVYCIVGSLRLFGLIEVTT